MTYLHLRCTLCQNTNQNEFVFDHQHGSAICTRCGCECRAFQMLKPSYRDYERHTLRRSRINTGKASQAVEASPPSKKARLEIAAGHRPALRPREVATTNFKSIGRIKAIRNVLEFLCHHFHHSSPENCVDSAIALYERNINIYETKYVAKKEIWAAACYSVDAELRKSKLSYKEIAAAFCSEEFGATRVEPKRICKVAGYIKEHERKRQGKLGLQTKCTYSETNGNLAAVSRLASQFGMNFKQERIARKIVSYIDEEELILGLNPLSILSVSFFLTFSLSADPKEFKNDAPTFVKSTLKLVSNKIHIAQNTIRKGIRDVRPEVLPMIRSQQKRLKVKSAIIDIVEAWEL